MVHIEIPMLVVLRNTFIALLVACIGLGVPYYRANVEQNTHTQFSMISTNVVDSCIEDLAEAIVISAKDTTSLKSVAIIPDARTPKPKPTPTPTPVKVEEYDDFRPGTNKPKLREDPVWLVSIKLPIELIKEFKEGYTEVEGKDIDLQELDDAYEEGLDQSELMNVDKEDEKDGA